MAKTSRKDPAAGRFAYEGLDRVIHEKARLGVLTSLMAHPKGLVFADLKRLCGLTDGNLSRHLQVLEVVVRVTRTDCAHRCLDLHADECLVIVDIE